MQPTAPILFDRPARRKQLARRAATRAQHDFLWREGVTLIDESLQVMNRRFAQVAELGTSTPALADMLRAHERIDSLTASAPLLEDTELLPFAEDSLDAIISNLSLHAANDLPGIFIQARRALKPDGLFLATLPGAESLRELRQVLAETEIALRGGITPRVAPFPEVREAGNLLQRAGFALPVVDSTIFTITYSDMGTLMNELRYTGEANSLHARPRHFTPSSLFVQAATRYAAQHNDAEGRIIATAEVLLLTAWKPAANQQQPAKRGSGKVSFHDQF